MKILLTGASGFIGSYLYQKLKSEHHVTGIDINQLDLTQSQKLRAFLRHRRFDVFIHLAAQIPLNFEQGNIEDIYRNNFCATQNLLSEFRRSKTTIFIHASSITAGNPTNFYSFGKNLEEKVGQFYAEETGKKVISLRIGSPYGPGQRIKTIIPTFVERALKEETLMVYDNTNHYFIYLDDIALAIERSLQLSSGIYSLAGNKISTKELARMIIALTNSASKIKSSSAEKPTNNFLLVSQAKVIPKFKPRALEEGLKLYLKERIKG